MGLPLAQELDAYLTPRGDRIACSWHGAIFAIEDGQCLGFPRRNHRQHGIVHSQFNAHLAKQGIQMVRYPRADVAVSYFAMEHPVVGGYEPHKVALRRAISWNSWVGPRVGGVRLWPGPEKEAGEPPGARGV